MLKRYPQLYGFRDQMSLLSRFRKRNESNDYDKKETNKKEVQRENGEQMLCKI
jgi:hypothetical protein